MASSPFKLSCVLSGHSQDVRSVATTWDGKIVSGSRDKTAKIWTPEMGHGYKETMTFCEHHNFVASVCSLIPTETYPNGLIVTGSNDSFIRLFIEATEYPLHILKEHTNTVCKLTSGVEEDNLLSSSWDKTAKLWDLKALKVIVTFFGHDAAVWSILQLLNGLIVTASADKTIKIWSINGSCQRTLIGHNDCVRDLAAINSVQFLSCSNDSSIREWHSETGDCLNIYYGHSSFIYSVSPLGSGFISSGEDNTVKVWVNGEVSESIPIPACSVWCVVATGNGDIVVGSSDGIIRVFSSDVSRQASAEEIQHYEQQLNILGNGEDIAVSNLPGPEALIEPGNKDNQTKLINENNTAVAYTWSQSEQRWNKVGTVVGSAGNAGASSSRKQVFEGVEYDFVFNVDVEEGKPPLKLPYNKNQNPWEAARNFIHQNNLSEDFLDEVANFIVKNSNQNPNPMPHSEYSDPFTGSARYVPGGSDIASAQSHPNNRNFSLPNSYSVSSSDLKTMSYFPQTEFITFDQANLPIILEKLLNINRRNGDDDQIVTNSDIRDLMKVCEPGAECTPENILTLSRLMEWPDDVIFPVLDVMRLAIRNTDMNGYLCNEELMPFLMRFLTPKRSTPPNNMLAMRVFCNMLVSDAGVALAEQNKMQLLEIIKEVPAPYVKTVQVALATLLLNVTVLIKRSENMEGREEALAVSKAILPNLTDPEAIFRALVALGTLLDNFENIHFYSGAFANVLMKFQNDSSLDLRIQDCATQILLIL